MLYVINHNVFSISSKSVCYTLLRECAPFTASVMRAFMKLEKKKLFLDDFK